jgi:hypothetical protein
MFKLRQSLRDLEVPSLLINKVSAGQINIGAQDWESILDGRKQSAMISVLGQVQG